VYIDPECIELVEQGISALSVTALELLDHLLTASEIDSANGFVARRELTRADIAQRLNKPALTPSDLKRIGHLEAQGLLLEERRGSATSRPYAVYTIPPDVLPALVQARLPDVFEAWLEVHLRRVDAAVAIESQREAERLRVVEAQQRQAERERLHAQRRAAEEVRWAQARQRDEESGYRRASSLSVVKQMVVRAPVAPANPPRETVISPAPPPRRRGLLARLFGR
jgi:hypothetical protein